MLNCFPFSKKPTLNIILIYFRKTLLPLALDNYLGWFWELMSISEGQVLTLAGLDVFGLMQAFKMMFWLTAVLAIPALLILMPYYATHVDTSQGLLKWGTYSINNVYSGGFWLPMVVCLLATAITLHFIKTFLHSFTHVRQNFLLKPSLGAAFRSLREATEAFGDEETARQFLDLSGRAVIVDSIPLDMDEARLRALLERAGGESVEKLIVVEAESFEKLKRTTEERQEAIERLEQALEDFNNKLKHQIEDHSGIRLPVQERKELLRWLLTDATLEGFDTKELKEVYAECLKADKEADAALNAFNSLTKLKASDATSAVSTMLPIEPEKDPKLVSFSKDVHEEHLKQLSHFIGKIVIVVFESERGARLLQQLLLSGNPFALQTRPAPPPNDLIWKNLRIKAPERKHRKHMGSIYYWLLQAVFAPISIFITNLTDLKKVAKSFPALEGFANSRPIVRVIVQGVVCPLLLIQLMNLMVPVIAAICRSEGHISSTEVQVRVLDRYSSFILIQTVLVGVVFSSILDAYHVILTEHFMGVVTLARKQIPAKAHFFSNVLIQACCIELMTELLRPLEMIMNLIFRPQRLVSANVRHENVRKEQKSWKPDGFEFGEIVSEAIVFPFHLTMTCYIINPLCIFPAVAYFFVAFVVYKYNALYIYAAEWESGGRMWLKIAKQMTIGLVLMQIVSALQFTEMSSKPAIPTLIMLLTVAGTVSYVYWLMESVRRQEKYSGSWAEEHKHFGKLQNYIFGKQEALLNEFPPTDTFAIVNKRSGHKFDTSKLPKRVYEVVPFDLNPEHKPFDEFDVDSTVDLRYARRGYSNPFILEYSQVIYLPAGLPARLEQLKL